MMWNALLQSQEIGRVSVPATPAARDVGLRENTEFLETVAGSGPRGRVQAADVLAAANSAPMSRD
jgi:pyruvate/2-oxoglutarate dehydrogenase complex dihydrolipoamide acyltransferase (E2) component